MSDDESLSPGLGFGLEAVVIRSHQLPTVPLRAPRTEEEWREWNINPAKHGPERVRFPPAFVPSRVVYDELGRCSLDGAGVYVDSGVRGNGNTAEWYKSLSRRSPEFEVVEGSSTGTATRERSRGGRRARAATFLTSTPAVTSSVTSESSTTPTSSTTLTSSSTPTSSSPHAPSTEPMSYTTPTSSTAATPANTDPVQWFTRRPLDPQPKPRPTSISTLLNINPTQPRTAPAHYVLGPENKGYNLLKDRLGWHGGGLGRPLGWDPRVTEVDKNGNEVVDLTVDSDEEISGPGRTAPIATALKIDRLGIGHRRSRKQGITHTLEEIKEVQRTRRRHGVELGDKGKKKWKKQDKKDREERKRVIMALNE